MITLLTGIPGASKTLNALVRVDKECQGRDVYYFNIPELKLPWKELTADQVHDWESLPDGSVIVIDESDKVWPNIPNNRESPHSVKALSTHRHRGFDFYVIIQKPTNIDHRVRGYVGRHFHYERVFSRNGAKEVEFQQCANDPNDKAMRKNAQIRYVPFNKKYFSLYKSAEIHTYKPQIPRVAYFLAGALLLSAVMAYLTFSGLGLDPPIVESAIEQPASPAMPGPSFYPGNDSDSKTLTPGQYAAQFVPRIPDVPHSAPIYDGVTEVKTYPRPQCILRVRNNVCRCYTQQATPLDISHDACVDIVHNGVFNPFQPDQPETAGAQAAPAAAPTVAHLVNDETPSRVTRIGNTPIVTRREINLQPRSEPTGATRSF